MTDCISSVIGYVVPVGSKRDDDNRPELEGQMPQRSTTVKRQDDEPIIGIIGEYHP